MIFAYAFCNVPIMPLRAEPSHRSEQTSQLLFGEKAEVLEINEQEWAKVYVSYDDYEGWCKISQLQLTSYKQYRKATKWICTRDNSKLEGDKVQAWMPLGSDVYGLKEMGCEGVKFKGKKQKMASLECGKDMIAHWAKQYMDAPYQWGGRSSAGIDCSGLTQMVYKLCNVKLPRDAAQQATEGETVDFLQHAHCGDLAFFDNQEGKITHVGILLDETTIIHATDTAGRVVTDRIDQGGIISTRLKRRTHNLRFVKRYF